MPILENLHIYYIKKLIVLISHKLNIHILKMVIYASSTEFNYIQFQHIKTTIKLSNNKQKHNR